MDKKTFKLLNCKTLNEVKKSLIICSKVDGYKSNEDYPFTMYRIDGKYLVGHSPRGVKTKYLILK